MPHTPPATVGADGRPVGEVARLFVEWLNVRQASGRIGSPRTLAGYHDDLARWAALLAGPGDGPALDRLALAHLTEARIVDALAVMSGAGYSTAARQRALAPLRGLCRWLVRRGHLTVDPTADEDLAVGNVDSAYPRRSLTTS